jgi:hypothetical protein
MNNTITYGIREMKKSVEEVNGVRVIEWVYETTLDGKVYDTREKAKNHFNALKTMIRIEWKKLNQEFADGTIDYLTYKDKDGNTFAIVTDPITYKTDCRYVWESTPMVRKLVLCQCYRTVRGRG